MTETGMVTNKGEYVNGQMQHAVSQDGTDRGYTNDRPNVGDRIGQQPDDGDLGMQFLDTVFNAARIAGCELLFEIPSALFSEPQDRAAAMRYGTHEDAELFFILFNATNGAIRLLDEGEVPVAVLDFTRSYAGVLGMIAGDRRLTAPLLQ
jgi:hypothetical protein